MHGKRRGGQRIRALKALLPGSAPNGPTVWKRKLWREEGRKEALEWTR